MQLIWQYPNCFHALGDHTARGRQRARTAVVSRGRVLVLQGPVRSQFSTRILEHRGLGAGLDHLNSWRTRIRMVPVLLDDSCSWPNGQVVVQCPNPVQPILSADRTTPGTGLVLSVLRYVATMSTGTASRTGPTVLPHWSSPTIGPVLVLGPVLQADPTSLRLTTWDTKA